MEVSKALEEKINQLLEEAEQQHEDETESVWKLAIDAAAEKEMLPNELEMLRRELLHRGYRFSEMERAAENYGLARSVVEQKTTRREYQKFLALQRGIERLSSDALYASLEAYDNMQSTAFDGILAVTKRLYADSLWDKISHPLRHFRLVKAARTKLHELEKQLKLDPSEFAAKSEFAKIGADIGKLEKGLDEKVPWAMMDYAAHEYDTVCSYDDVKAAEAAAQEEMKRCKAFFEHYGMSPDAVPDIEAVPVRRQSDVEEVKEMAVKLGCHALLEFIEQQYEDVFRPQSSAPDQKAAVEALYIQEEAYDFEL